MLLLEANAREDQRDNDGKTPEELAVQGNHEDLKLVFQHDALRRAIDAEDKGAIADEIRNNPEVTHVVSGEGWSVLHYAAYKGDADTVQLLLQNGANPDQEMKQQQQIGDNLLQERSTPLLLAAEFNTKHPDVLSAFLIGTLMAIRQSIFRRMKQMLVVGHHCILRRRTAANEWPIF